MAVAADFSVPFTEGWDLRLAAIEDAPLLGDAELRGDSDGRIETASLPREPLRNPRLTFFSIDSVLKQGGRPRQSALGRLPAGERSALDSIGRMAEFNSRAIEVSSTGGLEQWNAVLRRSTREEGSLVACAHALSRCIGGSQRHWHNIIESMDGADELSKLRIANNMINNGWRYRTDQDLYGVPEYWATASEFIANGGDCEDFAIAKFWTLKIAGISEDRMRIVVVYDNQHRDYHAVLSVDTGGRTLVLDNQRATVYDANDTSAYRPLFSYAVHQGTAQAFAHRPAKVASR